MTAIFAATAAPTKVVAQVASSIAVALCKAGNSLVSPVSTFPHNEPRRVLVSASGVDSVNVSLQGTAVSDDDLLMQRTTIMTIRSLTASWLQMQHLKLWCTSMMR